MKIAQQFKSSIIVAILSGLSNTAWADSSDATCEFYKHGDEKENRSGPCSFSQHQGNVYIDLRNGQTFSLVPGNKANHYKDDKGNKVERTLHKDGEEHVYKWDNKKIVVKFRQHESRHNNNVPPSLKDMIGDRARHMDSELERRGYRQRQSWVDGDTKYSAWQEQENGTCVAVAVSGGHIRSIEYTSQNECRSNTDNRYSGSRSNVPPSLDDMVGERARHLDSRMEQRGYRKRQSWIDGDSNYSAWEEQENGNCVRVVVNGGHILTIENTERSECRR